MLAKEIFRAGIRRSVGALSGQLVSRVSNQIKHILNKFFFHNFNLGGKESTSLGKIAYSFH